MHIYIHTHIYRTLAPHTRRCSPATESHWAPQTSRPSPPPAPRPSHPSSARLPRPPSSLAPRPPTHSSSTPPPNQWLQRHPEAGSPLTPPPTRRSPPRSAPPQVGRARLRMTLEPLHPPPQHHSLKRLTRVGGPGKRVGPLPRREAMWGPCRDVLK